MNLGTQKFLSFCLLLALLLGLFLAVQRSQLEASRKTVEVAVDFNDLQRLALLDKLPLETVATHIKATGVTSIGIPEDTLDSAQAAGRLVWAPGYMLNNLPGSAKSFWRRLIANPQASQNYIYVFDKGEREQVFAELTNLFGSAEVWQFGSTIVVDHYVEDLKVAGLGMPMTLVNWFVSQGFQVIPRIENQAWFTPASLDQKIYLLRQKMTANYIIFSKEEVLGYPDYLQFTARALKKYRLKFGYVELVQQDGDKQLARWMGDLTTKVQSIPEDKIIKNRIDKNQAILRFTRAVRERGIRLIYTHPFFNIEPAQNFLEYNTAYLTELNARLKSDGFILGTASPILVCRLSMAEVLVLGTGVLVLFLALLRYFLLVDQRLAIVSLAGFLALSLLSMLFFGLLAVQIFFAGLAALIAPAYAVISTFDSRPRGDDWFQTARVLLGCIGKTLIGIILIIGLTFDSRLMGGAELFRGIKLVLVLPIFLVVAYFFYHDEHGANLREKIRAFLHLRVTVFQLLCVLLFLGVLGIALARSDNFILPVFGFEKNFRNLLESIFFVRPRFKEFFIGYPLLLAGVFFWQRNRRQWLWLWLAAGTIGLTSLTNTFCHVHSPIVYSVLRSINGLVLGLLIGIGIQLIFLRRIK